MVKEKEKDLEKAEERGNALIQDKKGAACSAVKETLEGLSSSRCRLDQMVSFPKLQPNILNFPTLIRFFFTISCQISQMKVNLRSALEQWTLYRRASEEINGYLMEGRYSVSRLHLLNGSLEAVQQQVESLEVRGAETKKTRLLWTGRVNVHVCGNQSLQEEMEKQESSLRKFGSVTHQLLAESHPSVAETLNSALQDVNIR